MLIGIRGWPVRWRVPVLQLIFGCGKNEDAPTRFLFKVLEELLIEDESNTTNFFYLGFCSCISVYKIGSDSYSQLSTELLPPETWEATKRIENAVSFTLDFQEGSAQDSSVSSLHLSPTLHQTTHQQIPSFLQNSLDFTVKSLFSPLPAAKLRLHCIWDKASVKQKTNIGLEGNYRKKLNMGIS